jgi:hypothetical protein
MESLTGEKVPYRVLTPNHAELPVSWCPQSLTRRENDTSRMFDFAAD